jgi:hypothetical protein
MIRLALVCLLGCASPRRSAPEIAKPATTAALLAPSGPIGLPAPFTCGILARVEGCDPLWGCIHINHDLGSCYTTTSAVLTRHREEPTLDPEGEPPDTGLVVSSFVVQLSGRESCGAERLEAVKCTVDTADSCTGDIAATCRVWKDRTDKTEIPRVERRTLRGV